MAIENGVQNAELGYILDPAFQIEGLNGKPVIGGWICIYEAGTDNKYISYENFDGAQNPFKVPLKSDGRAVILGDPSLSYDLYFYDSYGNQLFSRLNVQCNIPGTINLSGADTRIKNTDGTLDISLQAMGNNVREYTVNTRNKTLDVQEPLYFVENSESATIIGCRSQSGDYATTAYVESAISGKLDISSYSSQSGNFLTDKFEYDNSNHITAYNNSAFAGTEYEAGDNIDITNHIISVTGLPTSSDVQNAISSAVTNVENKFEYNTNNYITAYNNSAFAGKEYSAGDYVSIENDTINVTGLQPSGDYATKTELESATSGKQDTLSAGEGISIVNNVISVTSQSGIEQVSHDDTLSGNGNSEPLGIANVEDFVKQNDLTAYQPAGDYYSASNPSGFITNDAITGLQPSGDYVTHDEMTGYQPAGDYYSASNPSGFITNDAITGLQPSGDYATHDDLTAYATTALVSSISSELYSAVSSISGDYELVAGSGVELVDDPNAKTTTINVTAEGTPVTAIQMMIESATSGISAAISGSYTLVAGNGIQLTDDDNARTTTVSVSGDYATTAQVADKLDTTAFSTVSGDFLTAHQDISDLMSKSESANFYPMTGNPSGFITEVPAGTMNENAFGYDASNNITAYNGSAFKAGDEFPQSATDAIETVTANSADWNGTTDTVSSNSGAWGGNALPISAGPGIKINFVDNTLVFSNDETVLYENYSGRPTSPGGYFDLSESPLNFDYVEVYLNGSTPSGTANVANGYEKIPNQQLQALGSLEFIKSFAGSVGNTATIYEMGCGYSGTSGTRWTKWFGYAKGVNNTAADFGNAGHLNIWRVVGINRK